MRAEKSSSFKKSVLSSAGALSGKPHLLSSVQMVIIITSVILADHFVLVNYFLTVTLDGSTLTAGPIVVVTFTDFMNVPFDEAGLAF